MGSHYDTWHNEHPELKQDTQQANSASKQEQQVQYQKAYVGEPKADFDALVRRLNNLDNRVNNLEQPASTSESLSVHGFTFHFKPLPKQDVMISGVNSPGREGLMVVVNDGLNDFSVAKLEWDHQKQGFVLFTGRGV